MFCLCGLVRSGPDHMSALAALTAGEKWHKVRGLFLVADHQFSRPSPPEPLMFWIIPRARCLCH